MVSFFKKRNPNRSSVALSSSNGMPPANGNGSLGKKDDLNDYIFKSTDSYVDPSTIAILKSSNGIPMPHMLNHLNSGPNSNSGSGSGGAGSSRDSGYGPGANSNSGGRGGSSRDFNNNNNIINHHNGSSKDGASFMSREHHVSSNDYINNSINSNSSLRNSSNSSSEDGNSGGHRRGRSSTAATKNGGSGSGGKKNRESVAYTEKDIFPNGVKRELKGIMLMGEGQDDVIRRARTYISANGELHFTLEDLDQYMLPNDFDDRYPAQLNIPIIYSMSRKGFESNEDDIDDLHWDSDVESAEPNGLSSWTPKSPEVLSQQQQKPLQQTQHLQPPSSIALQNPHIQQIQQNSINNKPVSIKSSSSKGTGSGSSFNLARRDSISNQQQPHELTAGSPPKGRIQLLEPQIEMTPVRESHPAPYRQPSRLSVSDDSDSDDQDDSDEQLQTKYVMELANQQELGSYRDDLDTEAIENLKTEDISKMDTIHLRTDYNIAGDDSSQITEEEDNDSFSDYMNDYQFFSNGTQKRRSNPTPPARSRSNSNKQLQQQQSSSSMKKRRSIRKEELDHEDDDTSSYDSDSISEDEYKVLSVRGGFKINQQQYEEEDFNDADVEDANDEEEEVKLVITTRKMSIINYFNPLANNQQQQQDQEQLQQQIERERLEKERSEKERVEKERLEKERLEKIKLEQIRVEKERIEKERLEKERIERDRLEKERIENERLEKIRLEKERVEKERIEKERLEKERVERDRLEKERIENERLEKERLDRERMEKVMLEAIGTQKQQPKSISFDSNDVDLLESLTAIIDSPLSNPIVSNPSPISLSKEIPPPSIPIPIYRKESSIQSNMSSLSINSLGSSNGIDLHSKSSIDNIFDDIMGVATTKDRRFSMSISPTQTHEFKANLESEKRKSVMIDRSKLEEERRQKALIEQKRKEEENQRKLNEVEMERQRRQEALKLKKKLEQEDQIRIRNALEEQERKHKEELKQQENARKEQERIEKERQEQERLEKLKIEQERLERVKAERERLEKEKEREMLILREQAAREREIEIEQRQREFEEERKRMIEAEQENQRIFEEIERERQAEEDAARQKEAQRQAERDAAEAERLKQKHIAKEIEHLSKTTKSVLQAQSLMDNPYGSIRLTDDLLTQKLFDKMKELEEGNDESDENSSSYSDDDDIQEYKNPTKIINNNKHSSPFFNNPLPAVTKKVDTSNINYVSDDDFLTSSSSEETELQNSSSSRGNSRGGSRGSSRS